MRRLTLKEVNEQYDGKLPSDAVLRPDEDEPPPPARSPPPPGKRPNKSERFAVFNAFTDFTLADLTCSEAKVWLILFRDTKGTGIARTGQEDMARRGGLSSRMVRYALTSLQSKGLLEVVKRGRLNDGPSSYRVHPTRSP